MQLLLIIDDVHVNITATAVRNVCNATLSLLFTTSLFIWGLLVNRKQAWRTDGGTAIFGCAALSLALVSTALNFLYVHKEDEFVWLPGLMWAVVLWQSFVGWWWWVGAGSGSGFATEDENRAEKLRREAKRASKKREAKEKKKGKRMKAQKVWQGVTAVFVPTQSVDPSLSQIRSRTPFSASHNSSAILVPTEPRTAPYLESSKLPLSSDTVVASDPNSAASSISTPDSVVSQGNSIPESFLPRALPKVIHRWCLSLRHAHVTAARQQTAERVQWIQQLDNNVDQQNPWGWGWGGFGWRRKVRVTPFVEVNGKVDTMTKSEDENEQDPWIVADWRTQSLSGLEGERDRIKSCQKTRTDHDCQDTDSNHEVPQGQPNVPLPPPAAALRPSSMWWWGPLRRWRLQDSTVY